MKYLWLLPIFFSFGYASATEIYSCRDVNKPSSGYLVPSDVSKRMIPFYKDQQGNEQEGYKWDIESITRKQDGFTLEASLVVYGMTSIARGNLMTLADGSIELHLSIWDDSGFFEKFVGTCKIL